MEIQRIGIIGVGLMGAGIAEVCARVGYDTLVREINDELLAKGLERIEASMQTAVNRGKLTPADLDAARGRVRGTTRLEDFADRDLVIEAAIEDIRLKQELFAQLDQICPPHAILASNTSSIPIIQLAAATQRPGRVLGMHFFNPVPTMQLIELVRTLTTSDEALETVRAVCERLGKRMIVSKDRARLYHQLSARAVPARCDSPAGARIRVQRGHRRRHDVGDELSDGAIHTARLHWARYRTPHY